MRTMLSGRNVEELEPILLGRPFELVDTDPELVITYGGDGAMLGAERDYPGVHKIPLRYPESTRCQRHRDVSAMLDSYLAGTLRKTELIKVAGIVDGQSISGINDVFIHNVDRGGALRYRLYINDELYKREIIGDGLGVATVHGSTAYYRSITHSIFRIGIGLAFNNSTEVTNHQVLPEDTVIRVRLTRGPALLVADNSQRTIMINEGDEVTFMKIEEKANIFGLDDFMCHECRKLRHEQCEHRN